MLPPPHQHQRLIYMHLLLPLTIMRDLPGLIYDIKYRLRLTLGLYGYSYCIYAHHGEPAWAWWDYLFRDLGDRPEPIISFMDHEDAWAWLCMYPQSGLYIRKERYVP